MEFEPPYPVLDDSQDSGQPDLEMEDRGFDSSSSGSVDAPELDDYATLLWAPRSHKAEIKPILRFCVHYLNDDGAFKERIKYLTLDQRGRGVEYRPGWFTKGLFDQSEPFLFPKGDWNQGGIRFYEEEDEEYGPYYSAKVSGPVRLPLPQLDPSAIWTWRPRVEYVDLVHTDIKLRETVLGGYSDRLRVVTHRDYRNHETKMVMKIWPSPMCIKDEIEREMMAYKACEHVGITPAFLGHVTEEGRVVGMLIEYIAGAHKPGNDEEKELCRQKLHSFHRLTGWHRHVTANHKDNFLIRDGNVYIIDLARAYTPEEVASKGSDWKKKV